MLPCRPRDIVMWVHAHRGLLALEALKLSHQLPLDAQNPVHTAQSFCSFTGDHAPGESTELLLLQPSILVIVEAVKHLRNHVLIGRTMAKVLVTYLYELLSGPCIGRFPCNGRFPILICDVRL